MKQLLLTLLCSTLSFATINNINSFKANFTQIITDDKNTSIKYSGLVQAQKPQNALWRYKTPILKDVYINQFKVVIVEPEIEQVIIKNIDSTFDFFVMIRDAKKIADNRYEANYKNTKFLILLKNNLIESIEYKDEFDNNVKILFENQKQNIKIDEDTFMPKYPVEFDIVRG
jgi:outer membrane lipoprotein carrier protein